MKPQPILETSRLLLRTFTQADAPVVASLASAREIAAMTLLIPHPYTLDHASGWISTHAGEWAADKSATWAITLKSDGSLLGAIGLHYTRAHQRAEIGYWIGVPSWGHGYATEAARAVVRCGFELLGLNRIYASHHQHNTASGNVLKKCGMLYEGTRRQDVLKWGEYQDSVAYAILRSEFAPS